MHSLWLNQLRYHYILKFQHRNAHLNSVLDIKVMKRLEASGVTTEFNKEINIAEQTHYSPIF